MFCGVPNGVRDLSEPVPNTLCLLTPRARLSCLSVTRKLPDVVPPPSKPRCPEDFHRLPFILARRSRARRSRVSDAPVVVTEPRR